MIEGLKIDVHSGELIDHLKERARHHDERRVFYTNQADQLVAGIADAAVHTSNDPVASLQASARSHQTKSELFQFLANHVVGGETYRLTEADMTRLEFIGKA